MKEVKLSGKLHNVIEKYKQKSDTKEFVLLNDFFFLVGWWIWKREIVARETNMKPLLCHKREAQIVGFFNFVPLKIVHWERQTHIRKWVKTLTKN